MFHVPYFRFYEFMIPLPLQPNVVQKKGEKAVFEIAPLYPGYAVTIGNTYRRVLLSSLEGSAITQVKINGANHEFATLPGVMEDVIIILINLKKIRVKNWSDEPQTIMLDIKGEKSVKAKDFKPNPQVKITTPDIHIATLTEKKSELEIEAKIEKGVGYMTSEEMSDKKSDIGVIALDAIFTPVKKVNFQIENMIVGKRTDFEKLELEIETDGTIDPEEAFSQATEIIFNHFSLFSEFGKKEEKPSLKEAKEGEKSGEKGGEKDEDSKKIKVDDLKISERTKNALLKNSLKTLGGISRKTEKDILELEGMGDKGIKEIKKILKKHGLEFKGE